MVVAMLVDRLITLVEAVARVLKLVAWLHMGCYVCCYEIDVH